MLDPSPTGCPLEVACPTCTSMLDGIDGEVPHITQHVSFAVAAKAPIERFQAHAHTRGWHHARLLSSAGTTSNRDYHAESSDAEQRPMATVFVRRDGAIHHLWSSELLLVPHEPDQGPRHVDFMWPLWAVLDRTPEAAAATGGQAKPGGNEIGVTMGDLATTRVGGTVKLAYLVRNTIMNLTTQDAQVACFRNVAAHLEPGGCFVIEVMVRGCNGSHRARPSRRSP